MPIHFNIRDFGALGRGAALETAALQAAIDACHQAGGGIVHCPAGVYRTGTLELKTHVHLHLDAGATLLGSADRADYRPSGRTVSRREVYYFPPEHLIFARGARNIALTGRGTIDGQAAAFFEGFRPNQPAGRPYLKEKWRYLQMIAFFECQDVLMDGLTLVDSPGWNVWALGCERAVFRGLTMLNGPWVPNTDGINVDCSRDVFIQGCHIEAGDDCIALKCDGDQLGREQSCERVHVSDCTLITTCNAVRIGYDGDGPIRDCTFSNLIVSRSWMGISIGIYRREKAHVYHGASIENIRFSNLVMDTKLPFFLWIGDTAARPGCIRNISFSGISATCERGCHIGGSRALPLEEVSFSGVRLQVRGPMDDAFGTTAPYPYSVWEYWNGRGLPHAFFCRHARNVSFHDVAVEWGAVEGPWRSALYGEQVEGLTLDGFAGRGAPGPVEASVIRLVDARNVLVRGCRAGPGTRAFLDLRGPMSRGVSVIGNDFAGAQTWAEIAADVPEGACFESANNGGS